MKICLNKSWLIFCIAMCLSLRPNVCLSENKSFLGFFKTGQNVYQSLIAQIVIANSGVFITAQKTAEGIPPMAYDPRNLDLKNTYSIFIGFKNGRYSDITSSSGKKWNLRGGFSLQFEELGISIFIDSAREFLGVIKTQSDKKQRTLFAIVGNKAIGTISDSSIVSLLIQEEIMKPFGIAILKLSGEIRVNGKPVSMNDSLGLRLESQVNPCRNGNYKFISEIDFQNIKSSSDKENAKATLSKALDKNTNPIKSIITVKEDGKEIIGFNPNTYSIVRVDLKGSICMFSIEPLGR